MFDEHQLRRWWWRQFDATNEQEARAVRRHVITACRAGAAKATLEQLAWRTNGQTGSRRARLPGNIVTRGARL